MHLEDLNGFSPKWVLSCSFKWPPVEKLLSHFEHLKGFNPVLVLSCSFRELDLEKPLSHFVHLNGFSPMWVLSCSFKWPPIEKLLSHFEHLKGFKPVLVLSCSFKGLDLENTCHTLCTWMASHLCGLICLQVTCIVTLWASKRLQSCISPIMLLPGTWSWKTLVTLCALEWLLSCVVSCVSK